MTRRGVSKFQSQRPCTLSLGPKSIPTRPRKTCKTVSYAGTGERPFRPIALKSARDQDDTPQVSRFSLFSSPILFFFHREDGDREAHRWHSPGKVSNRRVLYIAQSPNIFILQDRPRGGRTAYTGITGQEPAFPTPARHHPGGRTPRLECVRPHEGEGC